MASLQQKSDWVDIVFSLSYAAHLKECYQFPLLPGAHILRELKEFHLENSISRYHGGFERFRRLLGEKLCHAPHSSRKSWNYMQHEAKSIEKVIGNLSNTKALKREGYAGFASAVERYWGGLPRFRKLLYLCD